MTTGRDSVIFAAYIPVMSDFRFFDFTSLKKQRQTTTPPALHVIRPQHQAAPFRARFYLLDGDAALRFPDGA